MSDHPTTETKPDLEKKPDQPTAKMPEPSFAKEPEEDVPVYKACGIAVPTKDEAVTDPGAVMRALQSPIALRAVLSKLLWESGATISYSFIGGTDTQRTKVDQIVKEWFPYANIVFERVEEGGTLRIGFNPDSGSWSYVGEQNRAIAKPKQTMNLGWIGKGAAISSDDRSVILHEFGHALGLMHEHQSPARGGKINLDEPKLYKYYKSTQGWDEATIKAQIIDCLQQSDVSNYSELDTTSIMITLTIPPRYFMPAEMNLERINVPPNLELSEMDKAYMIINYPRPTPPPRCSDLDSEACFGGRKSDAEQIRSEFGRYQWHQRIAHQYTVEPVKSSTPDEEGTWCGSSALEPSSEEGKSGESLKDVQHALVINAIHWPPNSTITYGFLDTAKEATEYRKQRVRSALDRYEENTSLSFHYVDITEWDFDHADTRDRCQVRITFGDPIKQRNSEIWGWSLNGKNVVTKAYDPAVHKMGGEKWTTTYLGGQPKDKDAKISTNDLAMADQTLFHELGHVLGWLSSPFSLPSFPSNLSYSPHSKVAGKNVSKCLAASLFDEKSVMLYRGLPFKGDQTKRSGLNTEPSRTDFGLLRQIRQGLGSFRLRWGRESHIVERRRCRSGTECATHQIDILRSDIGLKFLETPRVIYETAPLHGLPTPAHGAVVATGDNVSGFLPQLVDALKQFFKPGGNQQFTLQFPGRFLDQGSYAWDTSSAGVYGQFIKPTVVNESEFRLVDQLYAVDDTVAGPNGMNLSIVYEQLLNNLLPKFVKSGLRKQQSAVRQWLMKDVEVSEWLKDVVENQKKREEELQEAVAASKDQKLLTAVTPGGPKAPEPPRGIMYDLSQKKLEEKHANKLTRLEVSQVLTNEYLYAKQSWELERDMLINNASRGDLGTKESKKALDEVTRQLAHITATRPGTACSQDAKDALRESSSSSMDGSMKIYPVQLSPLDWFEGLSTSFTLEDLTQDPDMIRIAIGAKSQQLDTLNSQLTALTMGSQGDVKTLQGDVAREQGLLDKAQSALAKQYTGQLDKKQDVLKELPKQLEDVQVQQDAVAKAIRALSQATTALSLAEATDTKHQQQQIRLQIQSLTNDLNELHSRWGILTAKTGGAAVQPKPPTPVVSDKALNENVPVQLPSETASGGSRWQTISLKSSSTTRQKFESSDARAKQSQWACNMWFASGSGSSTETGGQTTSGATNTSDTLDVAFRATLVTIDRGGWFRPQFFKQSEAFYKVNKDITWYNNGDKKNGLLPGYPVAFIIAKDIVEQRDNSAANATSAGGCLCFSYSKSDSSRSSSESSGFQAFSNGYVIKIPGPQCQRTNRMLTGRCTTQILGYMIQKTDPDLGQEMPTEIPADSLISDNDYEEALKEPDASKGPNVGHAPKPTASPSLTQTELRDAMVKLLDEKMGEMFAGLADKTAHAPKKLDTSSDDRGSSSFPDSSA
ncbi:hypothetical protein B0H14DRAFT_3573861 [Mycena olivaceomarginata]|nr:hypothetical protein B0H14DRAFT_3573861 [Mycena olivaceomarginata]